MQQTWSDEYGEVLKNTHKNKPGWGNGPKSYIRDLYVTLNDLHYRDTVLDYGCGKGALERRLDIPWIGYDPHVERFNVEPEPQNFVMCFDVLEHIELEYLNLFLTQLMSKVKLNGYLLLGISCVPAKLILENGKNAHVTVRPYWWWLRKLENYPVKFMRMKFQQHKEGFSILLKKTKRPLK